MMTLQLISITRSSIKDPGSEPFRIRGRRGASQRDGNQWSFHAVPGALVKGSALHLHPPGVIYRVRGKMNGRIKGARACGGRGWRWCLSTYRPTFTKRVGYNDSGVKPLLSTRDTDGTQLSHRIVYAHLRTLRRISGREPWHESAKSLSATSDGGITNYGSNSR